MGGLDKPFLKWTKGSRLRAYIPKPWKASDGYGDGVMTG